MAILAECPRCHRKQAVKNRNCVACKSDLVKPKRAGKVHYWIHYRVADGKQRWEFVKLPDGRPAGIEEARAAEGKRKAQKVENPTILERVPADTWTFTKLSEWYLDLTPVKKLASFTRIKGILGNFNEVFGTRIVSHIKLQDLDEYQEKREKDGRAPATIDMEISITKTMVTKAFDNDLVGAGTVKAFRRVKRKLRRGDNARRRTLTIDEYLKLVDVAAPHLKGIITTAYNTGMRLGELLGLRWSHIDRDHGVIRLPADLVKESRAKVVPMNHHVKQVLAENPRQAIHHDRVFTYRHESIGTMGGIKKSFITACERAGITQGRAEAGGVIFHDIRRTVKTNMLSAGVDKVYRDTILGHSLKGMDIYYMVPSEDDLHHAMARYTEWLDAQIADVSQTVNKVNIG
ncbi:MAG: site-specific integrase [Deltaproteobacteria bacterium]|nr:site-specific integrase [Deltaproteobacteria bacterium]